MKILGYVAIVIGLIFAISALFMDVSVPTAGGYRINNIGLMATRQNYMIFGGFIAIAGIIISVFGERLVKPSGLTKCPYCAEKVNPDAIKCKHCKSDITPVISDDATDADSEGRLQDVNVKYILGTVFVVFAVIITVLILYR